jgi:hypothetical protein
MPRATRKIKANNGKELSPPANPKAWLNMRAQTPSVAKYESTTVPRRTIALTILLSKSPRMIVITTRMIGIIVLLSRSFAVLTSK